MSTFITSQIRSGLEPFLSVCRDLGSSHVLLFGSAVTRPLKEVSDVDVHVVLPKAGRRAFDSLVASAEETIQTLAETVGRKGSVEVRHGPFKPQTRNDSLQFHLILDDDASLNQSTSVLLAHRAASGIVLLGEPLLGRRRHQDLTDWLGEVHAELSRLRDGLAANEIVFRYWNWKPRCRLSEGRITVTTVWDRLNLLKNTAISADLHFNSLMVLAPDLTDAPTLPFLSQLTLPLSAEAVSSQWERLSDEALKIIDERLAKISEFAGIRSRSCLSAST